MSGTSITKQERVDNMSTILNAEGYFTAKVVGFGESQTATGKQTFVIDFEVVQPPYQGFSQRYTGFTGDPTSEEHVLKTLNACGWEEGKPLSVIKDAMVSIKVMGRTSGGKTFYNVKYVNKLPKANTNKTPMTEASVKSFLTKMSAASERVKAKEAEASSTEDPFA